MAYDLDDTGAGFVSLTPARQGGKTDIILQTQADQIGRLRAELQEKRRGMETLNSRAATAERQVRDLVADRDQWRRRALAAEAELRSLGVGVVEAMP